MSESKVEPKDQSNDQQSFIASFYNQLNSVIGGANPNQFLCLTFPGTVLSEESFKYNVEQDKPLRVVANESRLANKLFDPVKVTGTDNGRLLTSQYKTALDMLSPRMNLEIMQAKIHLRKILATPYTYNLGYGDEKSTLQQVFYRLYDEWVVTKQKWAIKQTDIRNEIRKRYFNPSENLTPEAAATNEAKYQEEFSIWYQDNAEPFLAGIEEKQGKILSIFSINDMRIIQGILDTGTGSEIHEARTRLSNAEKLNPDSGTVYPVTFYPEDWHTKLASSFQYTDLLESEEALMQKIGVLTRQKRNLMTRFENLMAVVPDKENLKELKDEYNNSKNVFNKDFGNLGSSYSTAAASLFNQLATVVSAITGESDEKKAQRKDVVQKTADSNKESLEKGEDKKDIVANILNNFEANQLKILQSQSEVDQATTNYLQAAMAYKATEIGTQIMPLVRDLRSQLESVQEQIEEVKQKIAMAVQFQPSGSEKVDVTPNVIDAGYTELLIDTNMSNVVSDETKINSASITQNNGGFWLFGGSSKNETGMSAMQSQIHDSTASVAIGMAVTKVSMTRNWFNPGVFALTREMFKTTTTKISFGTNPTSDKSDWKDSIFPAYPVAFVVAKDVTIHVDSSKSNSDITAKTVEEHVSRGGGFFGFHSSSGSSSSSSSQKSSVQSVGNSVTVRFAEPQIIGYYLQVVPEDNSLHVADGINGSQDGTNYGSIIDFVNKLKDVMLGNIATTNTMAGNETTNTPTNAATGSMSNNS